MSQWHPFFVPLKNHIRYYYYRNKYNFSMIHIKLDTIYTQSISIPRYFNENPTELKLKLTNCLDGNVIEIKPKDFKVVTPYLTLEIEPLINPIEGEYEYKLIDSNLGVIGFGLAVIGDYVREVKSYSTDNKKIQYKR